MSTPAPITPASSPLPLPAWLAKHGKGFLTPYYLTIAAVLGLATVGFLVVIGLLVLVAANFNVLSLIE